MFQINNSMLTEPRKLTWPYGWCGHIPFVSWLVEEQQPNVIVELGTHSGNSYLAMCQAVAENGIGTKCYAVDTWKGDEHAGNYDEEVFNQLAKYHNEHYAGFSNLMRMTFDEANTYFSEKSIDLLHIDGFHTYDVVEHDFKNWLSKMSENGIILFHDINVRERNFGVWKLWEELCTQYPNYEFKHSHGLGVLFVGNASKVILTEKLKTENANSDALVARLFARLGELVYLKTELNCNDNLSQNKLNVNIDQEFDCIKKFIENKQNEIIDHNNQFVKMITDRLSYAIEKNEIIESKLDIQKQLIKTITERIDYNDEKNDIIHSNLLKMQQQILKQFVERPSIWDIQPLRFFSLMLKGRKKEAIKPFKKAIRGILRMLYYQFPKRWQPALLDWAIKVHPSWFKNHPRVLLNKQDKNYLTYENNCLLLDITQQSGNLKSQPGSIGIHCHIFYSDLINEFVIQLSKIPFKFDLFISVPNEDTLKKCQQKFKKIKNIKQTVIKIVSNRGRDIAPMFVEFGHELRKYDYIAHFQSKKSKYNNGATNGWREYLFNTLLGSSLNIKRIFTLFAEDKKLGIIYPQMFYRLPSAAFTWLANRSQGQQLLDRMKLPMIDGYFNFPAGSMFWAKTAAIQPLFDLNLKHEDFPEEQGQTDGTLAHALERLLGIVPLQIGYKSIIIKDLEHLSWSTYRFDEQYLNRTVDFYKPMFDNKEIKIIAFDIFDTLLVRPLLNPEHTKKIVTMSLDDESKHAFKKYRSIAEVQARNKKGKDVSINEIYKQFGILSSLSEDKIKKIQKIEEKTEFSSVIARNDVVEMMEFAKYLGKKVILISDMFLSRPIIEKMLFQNDINKWDELYLSSEIGLRKDNGKLYEYMLDKENANGTEVIMVGDNERSDLQLPADNFGIKCLHLLRACDLAYNLPEYSKILDHELIKSDINNELTAGLLIRKNLNSVFSFKNKSEILKLFSSDPYKLGYNLVGPVVSAFCQWLIEQAKVDKIDKLYFLAREGKFIKQVYDLWSSIQTDSPESNYLQLSRRCVTVPDITLTEDIRAIAEKNYFGNDIQNYFTERFGLNLDSEKWAEIYRKNLWVKDEKLTIKNKNIEKILPLLEFLQADIMREAKTEKQALMIYLEEVGLLSNNSCAVVDIGYSGTIQRALNKLLKKPIHGYYFATIVSSIEGLANNVKIKGCYVNNGNDLFCDSKIYSHSFELEKLLSANDSQIIKYVIDENNKLNKIFKSLSDRELASQSTRNLLQKGAIEFVQDAIGIRKNMYFDFNPSLVIADSLYKYFSLTLQTKKNKVLEDLILDDDYCGRGLVS
ncbi:HAD-IA family hydrolase [Snodgrassella alvi]|jgi:HAD superfamily hydrolase (TIGR01549 family)|uniref:HAD-IA family hydrolase n=1 Tax=Snodgrassella alvi TaxID=1196083 RepID=UPI000C1ED0EF|nr:HAD-IA family hydrolase [Snodgrassella alvi]